MDAFYGEVRAFPWAWAPQNWAHCDGSLVNVQQYQALFALIGNFYGGDGRTNFKLPNLQGRIAVGVGQGPGLSYWTLAEQQGTDSVTLTTTQAPSHTHAANARISTVANAQAAPANNAMLGRLTETSGTVRPAYYQPDVPRTPVNMAPQLIGTAGGQNGMTQPHENRQPVLAMNYCICVEGVWPQHP